MFLLQITHPPEFMQVESGNRGQLYSIVPHSLFCALCISDTHADLSDSLCSDGVQLQASGAQLSLYLLHVVVMGGRELPDPPVLFY